MRIKEEDLELFKTCASSDEISVDLRFQKTKQKMEKKSRRFPLVVAFEIRKNCHLFQMRRPFVEKNEQGTFQLTSKIGLVIFER